MFKQEEKLLEAFAAAKQALNAVDDQLFMYFEPFVARAVQKNNSIEKVLQRIPDSDHYKDLPKAQDHVDENWDKKERMLVLAYVTNKKFEGVGYRGMSRCRFCEKFNGSHDHTDGVYVWPEGFDHYIRKHGVKPPQDFIDHVLSKLSKKEPSDGARRAALRSPNYNEMSAREQWEEDKALGILDWDGD